MIQFLVFLVLSLSSFAYSAENFQQQMDRLCKQSVYMNEIKETHEQSGYPMSQYVPFFPLIRSNFETVVKDNSGIESSISAMPQLVYSCVSKEISMQIYFEISQEHPEIEIASTGTRSFRVNNVAIQKATSSHNNEVLFLGGRFLIDTKEFSDIDLHFFYDVNFEVEATENDTGDVKYLYEGDMVVPNLYKKIIATHRFEIVNCENKNKGKDEENTCVLQTETKFEKGISLSELKTMFLAESYFKDELENYSKNLLNQLERNKESEKVKRDILLKLMLYLSKNVLIKDNFAEAFLSYSKFSKEKMSLNVVEEEVIEDEPLRQNNSSNQ